MISEKIRREYQRWCQKATADADPIPELKNLKEAGIEDAFYRDLAFATGGLREPTG